MTAAELRARRAAFIAAHPAAAEDDTAIALRISRAIIARAAADFAPARIEGTGVHAGEPGVVIRRRGTWMVADPQGLLREVPGVE